MWNEHEKLEFVYPGSQRKGLTLSSALPSTVAILLRSKVWSCWHGNVHIWCLLLYDCYCCRSSLLSTLCAKSILVEAISRRVISNSLPLLVVQHLSFLLTYSAVEDARLIADGSARGAATTLQLRSLARVPAEEPDQRVEGIVTLCTCLDPQNKSQTGQFQ